MLVTKMTSHWPLNCQKYTATLLSQAVALPALSDKKAVIDQWWSVVRELLMLNTDGKPESLDELYVAGWSREKHYSRLKITRSGAYYKPSAAKSNVRAKILTD